MIFKEKQRLPGLFRTKGSVASCPLRPVLLCYLKSKKNVWDEYQAHPHGAFFDKKCVLFRLSRLNEGFILFFLTCFTHNSYIA